jgi:hypothetical protein
MIEATYRIPKNTLPPRTPAVVTPEQKGSIVLPPLEKPDLDFQTAGLELRWRSDCTVTICADASFSVEAPNVKDVGVVIRLYADPYYVIETGQHIALPAGFQGLILPHPRFYDPVPVGAFSDFPNVVPRMVALDQWPKPLSILCRRPRWDTEHILYPDEPFCQIIPVPRGEIAIHEQGTLDAQTWQDREAFIESRGKQLGGYEGFLKQLRKLGWAGLVDVFPLTDAEAGA